MTRPQKHKTILQDRSSTRLGRSKNEFSTLSKYILKIILEEESSEWRTKTASQTAHPKEEVDIHTSYEWQWINEKWQWKPKNVTKTEWEIADQKENLDDFKDYEWKWINEKWQWEPKNHIDLLEENIVDASGIKNGM